MGNCTIKRSKKPYSSSIKVSVPDLFYLNRQEKTLLTVISQEIKIFKLKGKLKLYKDSMVNQLDDNTIIIAGGVDGSSSVSKKIYLINVLDCSIQQLSDLPVPVKGGSFVKHCKDVYHIGGTSESEDLDSLSLEQGSPIMKYSLESSSWEVYKVKNRPSVSHFLSRKVNSNQSIVLKPEFDLTLRDLIQSGVFLIQDRVYLVGGKIFIDGKYRATDKIFSFLLNDSEFEGFEAEFMLPVKLFKPSCYAKGTLACVAGGFLETFEPNLEIFMVDVKNCVVTRLVTRLERPIEDDYPIFLNDKGVLCFSPPKLLYVREDKQKTYIFGIPAGLDQVFDMHVLGKIQQNSVAVHFSNSRLQFNAENIENKGFNQIDSANQSEVSIPKSVIVENTKDSRDMAYNPLVYDRIDRISDRFLCNNHQFVAIDRLDPKKRAELVCNQCRRLLLLAWECKTCSISLCEACADEDPASLQVRKPPNGHSELLDTENQRIPKDSEKFLSNSMSKVKPLACKELERASLDTYDIINDTSTYENRFKTLLEPKKILDTNLNPLDRSKSPEKPLEKIKNPNSDLFMYPTIEFNKPSQGLKGIYSNISSPKYLYKRLVTSSSESSSENLFESDSKNLFLSDKIDDNKHTINPTSPSSPFTEIKTLNGKIEDTDGKNLQEIKENPKIFEEYKVSPDKSEEEDFIAPRIRDSVAANKLSALRSKLNIPNYNSDLQASFESNNFISRPDSKNSSSSSLILLSKLLEKNEKFEPDSKAPLEPLSKHPLNPLFNTPKKLEKPENNSSSSSDSSVQ